jgi:GGDEF domain-containing protein
LLCKVADACRLALRLSDIVGRLGGDESRYTIGASIGLAMNRDMADEKSWLDAADKACYIAKRDGRGLLRIATPMQSDELHTTQG